MRPWLFAGVAALFWVSASVSSAATFTLNDGESLEGEIIHATRNTLMVKEAVGAIRQLSLSDVRTVAVRMRDGSSVAGALLGWRDGVYEVDDGGRIATLQDGRILAADEPSPPVQAEASPPVLEEASPPVPDEAIPPEPDAATLPVPAEAAPAEPEVSSLTEPDTASLPVLKVETAEASESEPAISFEIGLSQPASRSIFVVYGTFDRTAKAGEDYKQERGSLEVPAGDSRAVLVIPLIDDEVAEGDETFELFVSADEKLATVENNRVVGRILNDDE